MENPEHSHTDFPTYVTMLRLLVNLDPTTCDTAQLLKDLHRAKWIDNMTTELGLHRFPTLGIHRAEIINALASMLHGPLAKINSHV